MLRIFLRPLLVALALLAGIPVQAQPSSNNIVTLILSQSPQRVSNLRIVSVTDTTLVVGYSAVGHAESYQYALSSTSASAGFGAWTTLSANTISASASTTYWVKARAVRQGHFSVESNVVSGTTTGGGGCSDSWMGSTTNLTNRWSLEDACVAGTALSANVGSVTGTLSSTMAVASGSGPSAHTARIFDGTGQIALSANPLPSGLSAHSVCDWYKPTDFTFADGGVSPTILAAYQDASNNVRFGVVENTGQLYAKIVKGGSEFAVQQTSGTMTSDGTYYHACYTWDGTSAIVLYVDGSSVATSDATGSFSSPAGATSYIGTRDTAGDIKGSVYQLVIYTGVLSGGVVSALTSAQ